MIDRFTQRLMEWVHDAGFCSEKIRDLDYVRFFELIYSGALDIETLDEATDAVARYTSTLTRAELFQVARDEQLLIAPIATASELVGLDHFDRLNFSIGSRTSVGLTQPLPNLVLVVRSTE